MRLPRELETERLLLRPPRRDDLGFFAAMYADLEVVRYLSFKPIEDEARIRTMLDHFISLWQRHGGELSADKQSAFYVVVGPAGGPVGSLGVRRETYGYELSYALARSAWGHGYMPEAVRGISEWLLNNGVWRVFATCHVDNVGSQRTLEKAGFEREGRMRRYFTFPNLGPEPADGYLYARVRY